MYKQLLLGAEAIAQAALDAGIPGVYAYPGTPSSYLAIGEKELEKAIGVLFERKGDEIMNMNIKAFRLGKEYASQ